MSRIFLAGAAGVIGRRLTPLLLANGHSVWAATRSPDKGEFLRKLGARPVVVDVFDAEALATAVLEGKAGDRHSPADGFGCASRSGKAIQRPCPQRAHPRRRNSQPCRSRAQSRGASADRAEHRLGLCAWGSALWRRSSIGPECGGRPAGERAGRRRPSSDKSLEHAPMEGVVLRYGRLYGPGSGMDSPPARRRCMSMRRLTPHCSQSTTASRGRSTSPTQMTRCRPTRRPPRLAGGLTFGWTQPRAPLCL